MQTVYIVVAMLEGELCACRAFGSYRDAVDYEFDMVSVGFETRLFIQDIS
jgi:hypothetical protein